MEQGSGDSVPWISIPDLALDESDEDEVPEAPKSDAATSALPDNVVTDKNEVISEKKEVIPDKSAIASDPLNIKDSQDVQEVNTEKSNANLSTGQTANLSTGQIVPGISVSGEGDQTHSDDAVSAKSTLSSVDTINISNLEINDIVGSGRTAQVHRGKYEGNPVAIISIKPENYTSLDPLVQQALILHLTTADKAWRPLSHPSLLRFHGFCTVNATPALVTELMDAGDLHAMYAARQLAKHDWCPPLKQSLSYARDLASALAFIHGQSPPIAHGDVRPSRLLLTPDLAAVKLSCAAPLLCPGGPDGTWADLRAAPPPLATAAPATPAASAATTAPAASTAPCVDLAYRPPEDSERRRADRFAAPPRRRRSLPPPPLPRHALDFYFRHSLSALSTSLHTDAWLCN